MVYEYVEIEIWNLNCLARVGWWAFEIELRPIHVFRTTLETELKMRVGVYESLYSTFLVASAVPVSWFRRLYVFLTR